MAIEGFASLFVSVFVSAFLPLLPAKRVRGHSVPESTTSTSNCYSWQSCFRCPFGSSSTPSTFAARHSFHRRHSVGGPATKHSLPPLQLQGTHRIRDELHQVKKLKLSVTLSFRQCEKIVDGFTDRLVLEFVGLCGKKIKRRFKRKGERRRFVSN